MPGPLLAAHLKLCQETNAALGNCFAMAGVNKDESGAKFPEACNDLGAAQLECILGKRDKAMDIAKKLAGPEACEKVFPYYEDNKKRAMELIQIYKDHAAGGKLSEDTPFWNPST